MQELSVRDSSSTRGGGLDQKHKKYKGCQILAANTVTKRKKGKGKYKFNGIEIQG